MDSKSLGTAVKQSRLSFLRVSEESWHPLTSPGGFSTANVIHLGRDSVLWIGSSGNGVIFRDVETGNFSLPSHERNPRAGLRNNFVRTIYADGDSVIWVGHLEGLDRIDRGSGTVSPEPFTGADEVLSQTNYIQSILRDRDGNLWFGAKGSGLHRVMNDRSGLESFHHDPGDATSLSSNRVTILHEDPGGTLWVGTAGAGLNRLDPETRRFERYLDEKRSIWKSVFALYTDSSGDLWIGTRSGLARYDPESDSVALLRMQSESQVPVPERIQVQTIADSPHHPGIIWLGTEGAGVIRFDVETEMASFITSDSHGLPHDVVYGILPDEDGNMWVSTMRGLARFDPQSGGMTSYGLDRGLQSLEFNRNAFHLGAGGEMFFGGVKGLNSFFPADITDNPHAPLVALDLVRIFDRSRTGDESRTSISFTPGAMDGETILLPSQRDLEFEFVGLHFSNPERNTYRYRLIGFDQEWHESGTRRTASYTNLEPGTYTFQVAAASAAGVWSGELATWSFTIKKPLWQTWWFRVLAIIFLFAAIWGWYLWKTSEQRRKQLAMRREIDSRTLELKEAVTMVEAQKERLGEINSAKSEFVANISHELRTPLSLVLGPLEEVREGVFGKVPEEALQELNVALRNTRRMQRLVEQLLLVARLEAGELKLSIREGDLAMLLRDTHTAFQPIAERRGVDLGLELSGDPVTLWFDADRMEEIITNLLTNAMKYTSSGGSVVLQLTDDKDSGRAILRVEDSGAGIPASQLLNVFDRFYQVDGMVDAGNPGVGIGLSLTRELVELHGGRITVKSEVGKGSCFTVEIPAGRSHFDQDQINADPPGQLVPQRFVHHAAEDLESGAGPREADDLDSLDQATILIVDDNEDMRSLLKRQFVPRYRVLEAGDGTEGLALAQKNLPDVILSDVMMPKMDGNQLCRAIKDDPLLEFIPVVLLTARAELTDKISGLEGGADDYIVKPFNAKELRARIDNLILLRHRLKTIVEERAGDSLFGSGQSGLVPADAGFLNRVSETVQKNLHHDDFGVEELAANLQMSRAHLYRRLKGICGRSPAELIMEERLERGARFLAQGTGSVSEVAYGIGFKSLAHFSRRFSRKYGQSPSEYRTEKMKNTT
jgi:signal transduction histidine kinase/DNA-binding response OmpR family regulator/streptogramin lyase